MPERSTTAQLCHRPCYNPYTIITHTAKTKIPVKSIKTELGARRCIKRDNMNVVLALHQPRAVCIPLTNWRKIPGNDSRQC